MMRVLFTGNCQAQYLASALAVLTDVEVRFIGKRHSGVSFRGDVAPPLAPDAGQAWLEEVAPEHQLIVHQMTPYRKALPSGLAEMPTLLYPCVKFDAPFWVPEMEAPTAGKRMTPEMMLNLRRRADRMFNESSCFLSNVGTENLAQIEYLVRNYPVLLSNGHFSGPGMAWFIQMMIRNGLGGHIGHENAHKFLRGVREDFGLGFKIVRMPEDLSPSHEILWWPLKSGAPLAASFTAAPRRMAAELRAGLSETLGEHDAHALWAAAFDLYVRSGNLFALKALLALYRPRRYLSWARILVKVMLKRKRVSAGSALIMHRLALSDGKEQFLELASQALTLGPAPRLQKALDASLNGSLQETRLLAVA